MRWRQETIYGLLGKHGKTLARDMQSRIGMFILLTHGPWRVKRKTRMGITSWEKGIGDTP